MLGNNCCVLFEGIVFGLQDIDLFGFCVYFSFRVFFIVEIDIEQEEINV